MSDQIQGTPASSSTLLTTPQQSTTQAPPVAPAAPEVMTDGWLKGLDKSLATDPSLASIQDLPNLVKSYVNAQKMIGRDKVVLPGEHADPSEWNQVFEKLGVPKDPKEYQFKEKFDYDEEYLNDFKSFAKENGLLPRQAEAMLKRLQAEDLAMQEMEQARYEEAKQQSFQSLQKEYGQALDQKLNVARFALKNVADEGMLKYVDESGLGDDPQFIKMLVKIGEKFFREDTLQHQATTGGALSPQEAQSKINEINGDLKHPYWNSEHPSHKQAVADMQKLWGYVSK